jgi:hypothetical protein
MVKDAFAETFTDFASQGNKELFKELFASQTQPGSAEGGEPNSSLTEPRRARRTQKLIK